MYFFTCIINTFKQAFTDLLFLQIYYVIVICMLFKGMCECFVLLLQYYYVMEATRT